MLRSLPFILMLAVLSAPNAVRAEEPGYELHEWGVFTVPRNAAWANLDMKAEWASMPKEFYSRFPKENLPYWGPVKKPVIYFHADKPIKISLVIRFSEGVPAVWWPAAEHPNSESVRIENERNLLRFRPSLVNREAGEDRSPAAANPRELKVPEGHWVEALRQVDSSQVFCGGGHSRIGRSWDTERFIYYDGLMKTPPAPKVARDGATITLEVPGDAIWHDVMAIERDGKKVRVAKAWGGWNEMLDANSREVKIEMVEAKAEDLARLQKELAERLAGAGLNRDEADALVKVWKEGLFEAEGLSVFYRVPQATYDKWLPLEAKPAPKKTVRVGLVLHQHLEPELDERVKKLIAQLGSEEFSARDATQKELLVIGGAAFPMLEEATKDTDLEIARAAKGILQALDARPALEPSKPAK